MVTEAAHSYRSRAWLGYLVVGSVAAVVQHLVLQPGTARVVGYVLISGSAAAAVWCGVIWHKPRPALPWLVLAWSQVVYCVADTTFYTLRHILDITTFPGIPDLLYLAHYPLVVIGLVLLIRHRTPGRDLPGVLDAGVLAVAVALLSWVFLISPRVDSSDPLLVRAVLVAYPVADLAMLAVAIKLIMGAGRRPPAFFLLTGALLGIFTADTLYVIQQLRGTYQAGNYLDLVWLGGNLALGAAALHPTMRQIGESADTRDQSLTPARIVVLLGAVLLGPAMVMFLDYSGREDLTAVAVACGVLGALVIGRMALLVAEQRRLAITDDLTGLHTRRFLEAQLRLETARAARNGGQLAVFIVDVDYFKSVNDRYGHPGGDRVLLEIADRLRGAVRSGDVLARYGGEEFAVLAPGLCPDEIGVVADRIRRQIGGSPIAVPGGAVTMTVSVGAASYPVHDARPDQLIAVADRALYAAKAQGRDQAVVGRAHEPIPDMAGTGDEEATAMIGFLRRVARYIDQLLSTEEHSEAIGRWAEVVSSELGFSEATVRRAMIAGELHDVGKIVVPIPILEKSQPLTAEERELLRQHPDHGARLVRMVPGFEAVAEIIGQHHERFDGTGYPLGLAGDRIRIEARIIAVCDAWAAMRASRAYQPALSEEQAVEQLREGRGRQFDPEIVDRFIALCAADRIGRLRQPGAEDGVRQAAAPSASVFQKVIS